jgi:hypothetical protein
MPRTFLLPALFLAAGAARLEAQTEYYARLGAIGASDLLRDVIVSEITVRQSIAPMLALGGSLPIAPRYRAGLEATISSGGYQSDDGGVEADLGTVRTVSLLLALEGPVVPAVRWRLGAGALLYWPSEDTGIFLQGGTTRFLAGAGADYRRPALQGWDLMASVRYDYHRFSTDELEQRGFSLTQPVNRVSLSVGLARSVR